MTPRKMAEVVNTYEKILIEDNYKPKQMDTRQHFGEVSNHELKSHALYLCGTTKEILSNGNFAKANRHFASLQTILSFCNMYTLNDLMSHNR